MCLFKSSEPDIEALCNNCEANVDSPCLNSPRLQDLSGDPSYSSCFYSLYTFSYISFIKLTLKGDTESHQVSKAKKNLRQSVQRATAKPAVKTSLDAKIDKLLKLKIPNICASGGDESSSSSDHEADLLKSENENPNPDLPVLENMEKLRKY